MNDALKEAEEKLKALLAEAKAAGIDTTAISSKPIISHVPSKTCPFYSDSFKALVVPHAWTGRKLAGYYGVPWKWDDHVNTVQTVFVSDLQE